MSGTERLYYTDSHLTEFEARVTSATESVSGWCAVTLDRTAFYPTGGGQPGDTGLLNSTPVVECIAQEDGDVLHIIQGRAPQVGATVKGRVDWERRRDHMQQHTGQHILSQALVTLYGAETRSFRMMDEVSEIDVALDDPTDELIERAIELANSVIWEDRPVRVRLVTAEEAARLPLRKDLTREGELRLIEIENFDLSPCGGTHARRTGEVGLIAARSWERAKGLLRIEFAAGGRALADYRRANSTARRVASLFSVARDEAPASVARLLEEHKQQARHIRTLEEAASRAEGDALIRDTAPRSDGLRIIARTFDGRDADQLKHLALAVIAHPQTIALLGSRDGETARLIFARAADAPGDMNALMRQACELLDGRGGGRPDMAQGGGRHVRRLGEAIEAAAATFSTDQ
ncbi:MAG TPA: DHHA1 domain-containing protein [Pyrinomonadaceae bacterium]|jgi:alanyl-tRNA synthetase|nr:DHHA1 domain-containing protein [Pyrinomonadaceae bacterium]